MNEVRSHFPILSRKINGRDLIYFDSGATALKPKSVIDKITNYYQNQSSNVHRSAHPLAEESTFDYEKTRDIVKDFLNANSREEIIFTSGTTESINLIARSLGDKGLPKDAEIIISKMEHHSNIVPWQMLCERTGAKLRVIEINNKGELDLDSYKSLLNNNTYLVSVTAISNTLGTINPIHEIIRLAKQCGALTMLDAAQAISHIPLDVQTLDCDFLAFSGHKAFGPTGIGVLYGKKALLTDLPPFMGGGDMIDQVDFDHTKYNDLPYKFEAGTPKIASAIGLGESLLFIKNIGFSWIHKHEFELKNHFEKLAQTIPQMKIVGVSENKIPTFSFLIDGVHASDLASFLGQKGIAIRVGHHCTQPLLKYFGVPALMRASLSIYNTDEEITVFFDELKKAIEFFEI